MKFLSGQGIPFNVRCGGHSTAPISCAPTPEGAVLDLSLMRDVSVDTANQTVTFGGGCSWADVDDACWPHGLATVGGTVSHTGVGGLVLHGGFGFLSGQYGLAVDVLKSVEIVLANGDAVTASEAENSDLFWAVRGAGSSFGVVTSFTSKAFPQGEIWGGMMFFTMDKLAKAVDWVNFWAANNDGRQVTNMGFTHAPPGPDPSAPRLPIIILQIAYLGDNPSEKGPAFFAPVFEIEPIMKQVGVMPYPQINKGGDTEIFPWGRRYLFGGANFKTPISASTVETIADKFFSFSRDHPGAGTEGSVMLFEGVPHNAYRKVPIDATAFNSRGDYYNIGFSWTWDDASLDDEVRGFNRKIQKEVRALGYNDGEHKDGVGIYINYMNSGAVSAKDAFGVNGARLGELKEKYDPDNVFDKLWKLLPKKEEQWVA